ncbi:MAG: plastocyanin/azurin family copper-binding protein [Candidatus Binatia bacterium]
MFYFFCNAQYYLGFAFDVDGDGQPSVGEPFQLFNDRFVFPADPIAVPQSGIQLSFDDSGLLSGIAGAVRYDGHLGQVSSASPLIVASFADAGMTQSRGGAEVNANRGTYNIITLDNNTYYLLAFFDINGNRQLDAGEPVQLFNNKGKPPGDPVLALPNQIAINFQFADDNLASGSTPTPTPSVAAATPTSTPTPSPTPVCVGDCNGNGQVTVDEILTMVNIALGNAQITACEAGDANHDGHITVDEILTAVNNALNGCTVSVPTATPTTAPITHMVTVAPNGTLTFSPADLTIQVGETVEWSWSSSGHDVVSGSGCAADSQFCSPDDSNCAQTPTSNQGATYSHTFTVAGTYPYFCNVHCGFGMVGSITVQ